jgi:MarR family transcriptional regulator, 2-MHQ and catechol-resistance regulon repressor
MAKTIQVSGTRLWMILAKAARAVERNAQKSIAGTDWGLSDFAVLEVLLHKGPLPVSEIGKRVLLTSGSITTAIDRLEARKLVRRAVAEGDLRSRIVCLTAAGQKLIEAAFAKHSADMDEAVEVLDSSEREELVRLLKKLGLHAAERVTS